MNDKVIQRIKVKKKNVFYSKELRNNKRVFFVCLFVTCLKSYENKTSGETL